jgi:hypothetical protein
MSSEDNATIDRRAFVTRFMSEAGLTYSDACRVYEVMCRTFEDGVVTGSKIRIGKVGALTPVWKPAREINMHFRRGKGQTIETGVHRTYYVDGRYTFKFNLFDSFVQSHQLKWFVDFPQS